MTAKKQLEVGDYSEATSEWFRFFLKHLEIFLVETGRGLTLEATTNDYRKAAVKAVKLALLDSGMNTDELSNLFAQVSMEHVNLATDLKWSGELNQRRFQLIDRDIQGLLSSVEQVELAALTHAMREQVDSESHLPLEGAKNLHRLLTESDPDSTDLKQ